MHTFLLFSPVRGAANRSCFQDVTAMDVEESKPARRHISDQMKRDAVEYLRLHPEMSIKDVAAKFNVSGRSLINWRVEYWQNRKAHVRVICLRVLVRNVLTVAKFYVDFHQKA